MNADNKLISNQAMRQKISNQFGEELQTLGQTELDKRLEELESGGAEKIKSSNKNTQSVCL